MMQHSLAFEGVSLALLALHLPFLLLEGVAEPRTECTHLQQLLGEALALHSYFFAFEYIYTLNFDIKSTNTVQTY